MPTMTADEIEEWKKNRFENMINNCFRCHKEPYQTDPTHWHYCNDCVKVCTMCGELKVLWAFGFDFQSAEYKRWHIVKQGFMNASGHMDICSRCEDQALAAMLFKKPKITTEKSGITQNQLELMLKATTGRGKDEPAATQRPESGPNDS